MKIYLAGSSNDLERVKRWRAQLLYADIEVTSTWLGTVEAVGAGNPRDASRAQRSEWSRVDLAEVDAADGLWLLVPPPKLVSIHGSSVEWGYAHARGKKLIASGDTLCSIFTALGGEGRTDEAAFEAWKLIARAEAR